MVVSRSSRSSDPAARGLTLMDVARAAGVGKSTVSNVLNGTGRVGEAARLRVLDTIEQLGYQPHQGARSLRSRRTMRLAYLMPSIQLEPTNLIMMQFMQALLTAAARQHYGVLVVPGAPDPSPETPPLAPDPRGDVEDATAEAGAGAQVIGRGYRRLAYIGSEPRTSWDAEREAGFRSGLAAAGIAGEGAGLLRLADDARARAHIRSFLASVQPDAVLTGSDKIAIIVYGAAADL